MKKMEQAFFSALSQAEELLKEVDFSQYEDILFISVSDKSVSVAGVNPPSDIRSARLRRDSEMYYVS